MSEVTRVKYSGATPGADSNSYVLLDSRATLGVPFAVLQANRLQVRLRNSQAGTLRLYRWNGTTAEQVNPDVAVSAAPTGQVHDFYIGDLLEGKLEFTNGGVAQATWSVDIALICDTSPVT